VRSLRAFLLGTLAIGLVAYAAAAALAAASQAGHRTLELGLGPARVVSVVEHGGTTVTTFGPGLLLLALAGGVVNLFLARLLRRRAERDVHPLD
jgi:hypothetical protein